MIEAEVKAYRYKREITVEGRDVSKPVTMPLHPPPRCLWQGKGGREGGRGRERERRRRRRRRRGGEGHRRPSPHMGAKLAPVYWFGPSIVPVGSPCPSLGHQPPSALGRHPVGFGQLATGRPCHCHKEVAGGRRNRGRRRKEKKEGRRKEKKKKKRKGWWPSVLGRSPAARQAPGGASGGPRMPSTSLSPSSGKPGEREGGREGGREREREREEEEEEGERTIGGPPLTREPNRLSYTGSGSATWPRFVVPEPRAPAPVGAGEASGGVRSASHRSAMPLPQRGGRRKKKQGTRRKEKEEERKKRKRKEKKGGRRRRPVVGSQTSLGSGQRRP